MSKWLAQQEVFIDPDKSLFCTECKGPKTKRWNEDPTRFLQRKTCSKPCNLKRRSRIMKSQALHHSRYKERCTPEMAQKIVNLLLQDTANEVPIRVQRLLGGKRKYRT